MPQIPKIALIHPGKAYLPEVEVYQSYFEKHGFRVDILQKADQYMLQSYDVEWHLMGIDMHPKTPKRLKIHEYISLSLPPFARQKNRIKRWINTLPDLRIFHNTFVKDELGFREQAPFLFRDAGVGSHFFQPFPSEKKYDFVYHGSMDATRRLNKFFNVFIQNFPNHTLLVVGEPNVSLFRQFASAKNIHFTGRVPYRQVPALVSQATYGLNYIPPIYPYYQQPSLKLLEYCALDLKIITTEYGWVNQLERGRQGRFFKIKSDWSNFQPEQIEQFDFKTPDVSDLQWEKILYRSKILTFIQHWFSID